MKATINRRTLLAALQLTASVATSRNVMLPACKFVKIEADTKQSRLTITAADCQTLAVATAEAEVEDYGTVYADASQLQTYVHLTTSGDIGLETTKNSLTIKAGNARSKIRVGTEDLPLSVKKDGELLVQVDAKQFLWPITNASKIAATITRDDCRMASVIAEDGLLKVHSTNGAMLVIDSVPCDKLLPDMQMAIPQEYIKTLGQLVGKLMIYRNDNRLTFRTPTQSVTIPESAHKFPQVKHIIPKSEDTVGSLRVDRQALRDSLQLAAVTSEAILLTVHGDLLGITSTNGEYEDTIPLRGLMSANDLKILLSVSKLATALDVIDSDEVSISFQRDQLTSPIQINSAATGVILMPKNPKTYENRI